MKVMVIGGGGREHAVIKKLLESKTIDEIYALPGNGGIAKDALCVPIAATDVDGALKFAKENNIDFAVVTPDDPLVLGMVDALENIGVKCFGPKKDAAVIEGSKVFSKNFMKKYKIPTAKCEIFSNSSDALEYLNNASFPIVIKADGLALGKGVIIAKTLEDAKEAVNSIMVDKIFGQSGENIVIEEYLEGYEVSVLSFTDGKTIVPMVSSMDHKRALDGDLGLNTGGMGTIAPNPYYTDNIAKECAEKIFLPTINGLKQEGRTFKGCLYFGLMITKDGPKVIEYNCRFGDPEAQVVLPLLKTDLFTIMNAVADEKLDEINIEFSDLNACCVIMASRGYPVKYEKGFEITIDPGIDAEVFIAGAKKSDGKILTDGGRVLGVTALGATLEDAVKKSYDEIKKINFKNAFYRKDIGKKALEALK